jgi:hypothetical protein
MTQRPTSRDAFRKAFLKALAGPVALYQDPPRYDGHIPKASVADTFAQVGLFVTSAAGLERHDRRAATEAAGQATDRSNTR